MSEQSGAEPPARPGPAPQVIRLQGIPSGEAFGVPRILIRSHLWLAWSEVALEHEDVAHRARARLLGLRRTGSHGSAEAMYDEFKAALVTITAAINAIDALTWVFREEAGLPAGTYGSRGAGRMLQDFEAGFHVGRVAVPWLKRLKAVYTRRGSAVHFHERTAEPVPHPAGVNAAPEDMDFSSEHAQESVDLLIETLELCTASLRPRNSLFAEWARIHRPKAERLSALRADLQAARDSV